MNLIWQSESIIAHTQLLTRSFRKWTGRDLLSGLFNREGLAKNIFRAPFVVVSHGTETDPILNYGNAAALDLWEMSWEEFTRTPSRLTAEAPNQIERAKSLEAVARDGFIENYSGVRISKSGRRFEISNAVIWNLVSERGEPLGQAATFDKWNYL
jgi:hypothetical protein